jgi:hypothetical protein
MPLNCTVKNIKMINFLLCLFDHKKKERKKERKSTMVMQKNKSGSWGVESGGSLGN